MIVGVNYSTPSSYSASLPPLPLSLQRSVSDSMPSTAKTFSRSSNSNEMGLEHSPNSKRLKRMKEGLKEMKMWWEELLNAAEEAADADENSHILASQADSLAEFEEAVNVERTGECLLVNFKCPCGKGYQILLSSKSSYYKLI
ncbi:Glycerol kinase [Tripterygium wilfordii]|uniref:Glycerol kinase n=1 Tax=Tripterygium wilfordii TaxID=458696 RepID=A0A7J7E1V2_TRIWF|nr:Glycerol kinase [Tripterygium wilfordii]